MQLTNAQINGAAIAAAAALGLVALGQKSPGPEASLGHVSIDKAPVGSVGIRASALADASMLQMMGMVATSPSYVRANICAVPSGTTDPGQYSVPGLTVYRDDDATFTCIPGVTPMLEAWAQARADAPWLCACAKGPACLVTTLNLQGVSVQLPGGRGLTFSPGTWLGADCLPKPCEELGGISSMPTACN